MSPLLCRLVALLVSACLLLSQLSSTAAQSDHSVIVTIDQSYQTVYTDFLLPVSVNYTGTITALANNNDTVHVAIEYYTLLAHSDDTVTQIIPDLPALAPGESYSGLLVTLIVQHNNGSQGQYASKYDGELLVFRDTVSQNAGYECSVTEVSLLIVQVALNSLDMQLHGADRTVVSEAPYVTYFNGTVIASATNNETLYVFLSIATSSAVPNIAVVFASVPPLLPGESYDGVLMTVTYPPYSNLTSNCFSSLLMVDYSKVDSLNAELSSVAIGFELTVVPQPFELLSVLLGDPMFVGLRGQRYQVHGLDGAVYNLISDRLLQVNARFTYLDSGSCLRDAVTNAPLFTCWTHRGSYLSALAVMVSGGASVLLTSGAARDGFASVAVAVAGDSSGRLLSIGESATVSVVDGGSAETNCTVTYTGLRTVHIAHAGVYSLVVENSDHFLNLLQLTVHDMRRLTTELHSHGLIGQTWDERTKGAEVNAVAGYVDDYAEAGGDLRGCGFVYNRFSCE